tara:strand:+ start:484 stop:2154 length:1671 start_codon:yes stop_codon:yes gene_type:complete
MALGYGYVRDDDPVQINWREISKSFTDRIKADQADRQKRKDDIQTEYNQLQKDLINKPQGYNTDLNNVVGSFSNQASVASLDLLNKLKTGQISEQEYYTKRANLKSSTENFFLYSKNFNDNYDRLMDLAKSNDPDNKLSAESIFQLQLASDMLDFKKTTAIVDPGTNELILVKTDEDGNPTDEIVNVSQLGYLSSDEKLSYNYKNVISENLKNRGVRKFTKNGKVITTIQGVEVDAKTGEAAINGLAEAIVGDQSQIISILAQNGYTITKDPSKKNDPKTIYYDMNTSKYDFDRKAALDIVTDEINNSISVEVKDEISRYQEEQLKNERERIQIAKDNLALATQKANVDADSLSYKDADNFMVDPDAPSGVVDKFIKPIDYIKKLNSNSFKSKNIQNTVDGLQSVLNHQGMKDAVVNTIVIEPPKKGGSPLGNLIRQLAYTPPSITPPRTKYTDATYGVEINIPGVLTEPIVLPIKYSPQVEFNSILETIDYAKENKLQITPDNIAELLSAPNRKLFNDYRNIPVFDEEKVEVENVIGGVDKIKNVINKTQNNNID